MIMHIKFLSIPVRDYDRAVDFYTKKLGFRITTDQRFGPDQRWVEMKVANGETGLALFTPPGQETASARSCRCRITATTCRRLTRS